MSISKPALARRFFWLSLLAAALPLAMQGVLFLRSHDATANQNLVTDTTIVMSIAMLAAVILTWAVSRPLWRAVQSSLDSVHTAIGRILSNDFGARADIEGPGPELAALGHGVDSLLDQRQREVLNLSLEGRQAESLLESSRRLIEECIYAREPLAKQHPGLAAAYAAAAIRHGQEAQDENHTVHGLVEGVDGIGNSRANRENLRWTPKDVRVEVPMPSELVNMSVSGMAVESNRGLPVGGAWVFRVGTDAVAYEIPGRICWCKLQRTIKINDEVQPVYRTGVEFDNQLSGKAFDFFGPTAIEAGASAASI